MFIQSREKTMDTYNINKTGTGWALTKQGSARPSKTADTKEAIIDLAKEFLSDKTASLRIHSMDGRIQEERTYPRKADPTRSPG
jgi:hypothetical protein